MAEAIRVLIVDGSPLARQMLQGLLARDDAIEVVGVAASCAFAWEKIRTLRPDVITLDVLMPETDGFTLLARIMKHRPMPVVMVSVLTEPGADATLKALQMGAVDCIAKPRGELARSMEDIASELLRKVKSAAAAKRRFGRPGRTVPPRTVVRPAAVPTIVAIGASTGGPVALRTLLEHLPEDGPAVVIVQHMPERFTPAFAEQLDRTCTLRVSQAEDGDLLTAGRALVAPGNRHVELARDGGRYRLWVHDGPPVNHHRPSVDVLFHSVAAHAGRDAIAVLMTGMGGDGASGLLAIREAGGRTIAQNEATSVVFGMPSEAIKLGAAERVLPLDRIAGEITALLARGERPRARRRRANE
jgi:two-component system chemotaxis response regulator CheB